MLKIDLNSFQNRYEYIRYVSYHRFEIVDKNELIIELCKGKKVLDLGCIDHSYETAINLGNNWLHKQIKDVAAELTGLDILQDDAEKLNKIGYNILVGNAEDFDLKQTFDVIVAGDLIEHLSNIGLFLQCIKKHMHSETLFVFTTPNPFNLEQSMAALFNNKIHVNTEHVTWIDPNVAWELINREGLRITGFHWIDTRFDFNVKTKYFNGAINRFIKYMIKRKNLLKRDYAIIVKV